MSTNSAQLAMVDDIGRFLAHMPMKGDAAVSVLKGHLLVEEMLWSIVRANVRVPAALETTRFGFEQALCLARALAGDNNESWEYAATKRLNQLRNQLAHRLEPKDIDAKLQEFVAFVGSASPRKATAVSADPNLSFFGRCELAFSSPCVFFRSASLTRLLRG